MNLRSVDLLLERDHEIPSIPPVVARVMQTIESSTSSARDLGEIISLDHALTTRILRVANSAYYGFPKEISTVTTAVIILGFVTVRGIALGVSLLNLNLHQDLKGKFSNRELWRHSVGTAIAAKELARIASPALRELAFSAGLLHDLGKALLAFHHGRKFAKALEDIAVKNRPQLVMISAGFDTHELDPVGSLGLEDEDFATLTDLVLDVAEQHAEGRVISVLEGGYNVDVLPKSVGTHLNSLLARGQSPS